MPHVVLHPRHISGPFLGVDGEQARQESSALVELTKSFTPSSCLHLLARVGPQALDAAFRLGGWSGLVALIAGQLGMAAGGDCSEAALVEIAKERLAGLR